MAETREGEFTLPGPGGGVNLRTYSTELPEGEYEMLRNLEVSSKLGIFASRKGTTFYGSPDPGTFNANAVRGGIRFYHGTTGKILVVGCNTQLWTGNDTTGVFTVLKAGFTANQEWFFTAYLDILYAVNGANAIQRYDGPNAAIRDAGFAAPGTVPTLAAGAAGILVGNYRYKITFLYDSNDAEESNASAASAALLTASQQIDLSAIPTGAAGSGVTGRNIYRTTSEGTSYAFVAKIANNTATTYTDNLADSALGTNAAPTDNGIPPSGAKFCVMYRNRLVVANTAAQPQRVFLSSLTSTELSPGGATTAHGAHAEIFPASHFIDVGDNNSAVTGLAVLNDTIIIFKEDGIYSLMGDNAQDMSVLVAQATTGCIAPRTIVNMNGGLFFLGRTSGVPEVYFYNGGPVESASLPIETYLQDNLENLGDTVLQPTQPSATRYRGMYIMSFKSLSGSDFDTAIFDTRPPEARWMFMENLQASCWIPWNGRGDKGEMYFGRQDQGQVLRFDTGTDDYLAVGTTQVITMTVKTKWYDFGRPFQWKQIKHIEIYAKGGSGVLTVKRSYDFATTVYQTDADAVTMTKINAAHDLYKLRINCATADYAVPSDPDPGNEQGYLMQMTITTTGVVEMYRIVVFFTVEPAEMLHDTT